MIFAATEGVSIIFQVQTRILIVQSFWTIGIGLFEEENTHILLVLLTLSLASLLELLYLDLSLLDHILSFLNKILELRDLALLCHSVSCVDSDRLLGVSQFVAGYTWLIDQSSLRRENVFIFDDLSVGTSNRKFMLTNLALDVFNLLRKLLVRHNRVDLDQGRRSDFSIGGSALVLHL